MVSLWACQSNSDQRDLSTFPPRQIHHCLVMLSRDRVISLELSGCNISPVIFCKLSRVNKLIQQHNAHGNQFSTSKSQTMHCRRHCLLLAFNKELWLQHAVILNLTRIRFPNFSRVIFSTEEKEVSGLWRGTCSHWGKVVGSWTVGLSLMEEVRHVTGK